MEEIIGKVLLLNKETAPYSYHSDEDYMSVFIRSTEAYLNAVLQAKGYISYETIVDSLGIKVTPDELEKTRILRDTGKGFCLKMSKLESDDYEIKICERNEANG